MKTKLVLSVFLATFLILGCSNNDENSQNSETVSKTTFSSNGAYAARGSSVTTQEFPQAQQEVLETWERIVQSVEEGDLDELISFHAYGPKFTEFKDGEPRNGAEANEAYERGVFGAVTEVISMAANDLKVAVYYGNVAIVTFHSDFHLLFEGETVPVVINNQITLVFVKTSGEWKIVHEHHAPLL